MFSSAEKSVSEQILEQLSVAVFLLDNKSNILFTNQHAASLFCQTRKKLINQNLFRLPIKHSFPENLLTQLWQSQQPFVDHEVEWFFIDGLHIVTEVSADLVLIDGQEACLVQIRENEHLRRLNEETAHKHHISASRHLIRGLAHEIKNPLGGIRGAAQLLSRSLPNDDLNEYTQMIIEQSDRLKDLVDRLLGPNKLPQRQACNIHNILERVCKVVELEAEYEIKLKKDYDPSLPDLLLDSAHVEQALLNILQNAVYAAAHSDEPGRVFVSTRFVGSRLIHNVLVKKVLKVSIADNGAGISHDMKATLFYPMVTNKPDGNGLGLSISQRLIDQHSGMIEVESKPGNTEFSIYLPVQETV